MCLGVHSMVRVTVLKATCQTMKDTRENTSRIQGEYMDPIVTANMFGLYLKKMKGVTRIFICRRTDTTPCGDDFQKILTYFTLLSSRKIPKKVFIQTQKGYIIICITETFFLGVVLQKTANVPLVNVLITRTASALEQCTDLTIHDGIKDTVKKRIDALLPGCTTSVTLVSKDVTVEGKIIVTVTPPINEETLKKKIQAILDEEIPFFCEQCITIVVNQSFSTIAVEGLTVHNLLKVIHRIQAL